MKSPDVIRNALARLNRYYDSREDILDVMHEDREAKLRAAIHDCVLNGSHAMCEALEWVLEINPDPESENELEHLLGRLEAD